MGEFKLVHLLYLPPVLKLWGGGIPNVAQGIDASTTVIIWWDSEGLVYHQLVVSTRYLPIDSTIIE